MKFDQLKKFLDTRFHQDFESEGDVEEIVRQFVNVSSPEEAEAVRTDIRDFLAQAGSDAASLFVHLFHPDVVPGGWGMATEEWLLWISALITDALAAK